MKALVLNVYYYFYDFVIIIYAWDGFSMNGLFSQYDIVYFHIGYFQFKIKREAKEQK